ncbi:NAD(P)/FAD-dependent oxidoreductase [Pseudactinotalea sp. Z1748]|uniref:NAD(P)/FAD-dependent oxidoreductase n=1 Tax=Pseudactinotalea sp. Z1748 TaxID=3413027 RepID=UPI003C7C8142
MNTSTPPAHVVVVGAGLAGLRTCAALRERGYQGRISVVGAEDVGPYDRPPLSKELFSRPEPAWLHEELGQDLHDLAQEVYLGEHAVELRPGGRRHRLSLASGAELNADAVVLACGSLPLNPWPGASALHTAADAVGLRARLAATGQHLLIIGAGWIGAEVAGVAAAAGGRVTVVEAAAQPLSRQLPAELGERTRPWYAEAGVELRTGTSVATVRSDGVELGDGERIGADVVLAAVGVVPATGWLAGAVPLGARGHVLTDANGRTKVPGVWAVGDCAWREDPLFGQVPGGHWSAALHDPDRLGAAMLGLDVPEQRPAPFIYSTQLGHHLSVFGRVHGDLIIREYGERPMAQTGPWTALVTEGPKLVGAVIADMPRDVSAARRLLGTGTLPDLDLAAAEDPAVRLRAAVLG